MGLWNNIINTINGLDPASSKDYKQSYGQTQNNINQYTGNAGYQNSLNQAIQGAGQQANAAVGTATSGARNAGMSKAQAAAMGTQQANANFNNAFNTQQGNAMNMGQNAISAQQGQTSQAASEKQANFGRANTSLQTGMEVGKNIMQMLM